MKKFLYRLIILSIVFFPAAIIYLYITSKIDSANLTSASATLSNSRLSYRAGVATGAANSSIITIDASGFADNDTNHLFPKDSVCFADATFAGCYSQAAPYSVVSIPSTTTFNIAIPLGATALGAADLVIATQSGSLTIAFTTVNQVPSNGDILITLPALDTTGKTCDGFPDTNTTVATNGFDLSTVAAADISVTGCTDANWNATETITCGTSSADHTIRIDRQTTACAAASAITVTIDSAPGVINPAPITGHAQGTADIYEINIKTRDGADATLDNSDVKVAPIEGVFVSATVDETLSFAVAGAAAGTHCGLTTDVTSTAYSIPWGTIAAVDTFYEASQQLTVSTNADAGYTVKIEANDQMGKDGVACTGATAGESVNCIKDTTCGASACSESAAYDWTVPGTYQGLGISLADVDGTDAVWDYDGKAAETTCTSGTFCARQIADQEASETKATIMTNTGQVSSKDIDVCYRIAVSGTQPAGYYFNKVKYTATATF